MSIGINLLSGEICIHHKLHQLIQHAFQYPSDSSYISLSPCRTWVAWVLLRETGRGLPSLCWSSWWSAPSSPCLSFSSHQVTLTGLCELCSVLYRSRRCSATRILAGIACCFFWGPSAAVVLRAPTTTTPQLVMSQKKKSTFSMTEFDVKRGGSYWQPYCKLLPNPPQLNRAFEIPLIVFFLWPTACIVISRVQLVLLFPHGQHNQLMLESRPV